MIRINRKQIQLAAIALLLHAPVVSLKAELSDVLDKGLLKFNQGQYLQASREFETAALMAQQMHSNSLEAKLRKIEPADGWHRKFVESVSMDGNNIAVEFVKLNSEVYIELGGANAVRDSVAMMVANPLLANANGGDIRQVKGQSGVLKFDPVGLKGKIQFALDNVLVTVRGSGITEQELIDYSMKVPFGEL